MCSKFIYLLPNTELTTTKQVAEFYGVKQDVITWHLRENREELESNGMKFFSYIEIKETVKGEFNSGLKISKRGTNVFNKRAILLVGFMLRDSKVAQEVRNQALNIIEGASDEHKTFELDKERELLIAITLADNPLDRATVSSLYVEYVNRHKKHQ